ncbi:MAG: mycofactocin-coupled SDR family oxidoreductase [Acidimicrobiia bacterium]
MGMLDGQVALITGGARGQGRAHALALAREGCDIVVCDIAAPIGGIGYPLASRDDLDETVRLVEEQDKRAMGIVADMRDTTAVGDVVGRALETFDRIDILVANHGVVNFATVEDMTDEMWDSVVDTNLTGVFKIMRAVIPTMKAAGYGRIIVTASAAARGGFPNLPAYVAAKWGLLGLVKGCALELADTGITVNAICPSAVATDLFFNEPTYRIFCPDIENPGAEDFERRLKEHRHGLNGRPYLQPEHVSRTVVFLATDLDGVLTGQVSDVGLGLSASKSS